MKANRSIAARMTSLLVPVFMLSSAPHVAADPKLPGGQDSYDQTDQQPSWAKACRDGWSDSDASDSCTKRGTIRVDFTRTCTVDADCNTDDGGTNIANHRGTAANLRTLQNCDGELVRTACPPPPPPPDPPHPFDSAPPIKDKLTETTYQARHATCLVNWQNAPFITHRNCWNISIEWVLDLTIDDLLAGRLCKVTATCRRFITLAGLGRLSNDLTTSLMIKPSEVSKVRECDAALTISSSCPAGTASTDRRNTPPSSDTASAD